MKVKKLIKALNQLDPNAEVVLASDEEGNRFSLLADICVPEEQFDLESYDFYSKEEFINGKNKLKLVPAIILYPL